MGWHAAPYEGHQPLSPSQIADLRLAAATMTGAHRRAFEAEMPVKYCAGNPLVAETTFGWGRQTVAVGLAERRTGIWCRGAHAAFSGRQRWEEQYPEVAAALERLAEAHAQQGPALSYDAGLYPADRQGSAERLESPRL
jgi:hypothetical protein